MTFAIAYYVLILNQQKYNLQINVLKKNNSQQDFYLFRQKISCIVLPFNYFELN